MELVLDLGFGQHAPVGTYFFIVYNASRKKNVETLLNNLIDKIILINDNSLIAIQGPYSSNILSKSESI